MIVKDHWRITTHAIQLEMERLAGLLQKSAQFYSRTSTPHSIRERNDVRNTHLERNDVRNSNLDRNDVRSLHSSKTEPTTKPEGALL